MRGRPWLLGGKSMDCSRFYLRRGIAWMGLLLLMPLLGAAAERTSRTREEALASLGEALFFDTSLSADGAVACATCHRPDAAFTDGRAVSRGAFGRQGTRNAPSLMGLAQTREFFWDGRRTSLEALVMDPLTTAEEHGLAGEGAVLALVQARHAEGFARVFPDEGVTRATVAKALAAYLRQLVPAPAPFERFQAGEAQALLPEQRRGFALFVGRAGCARCHRLEEGAFTDGAYHPGEVPLALVPRQPDAARNMLGWDPEARRAAIPARADVAALGRYAVSLRAADLGRFRTPSLRNVARTAPYMHDGSVPTLAQAVERELYYRKSEGLQVGDLTPADRSSLVAFLQALTSPQVPTQTAP
ncbi:cytochrome c family protein [Corallococcus sp. AB004]|uniref:cytochrome-c peroxidase n=1 Tax=Corallococcus exiguus TaxID=83462 RepID=UPI000EA354A2|nr:cytochrome c family protein [Corallococcus sp. AB004]